MKKRIIAMMLFSLVLILTVTVTASAETKTMILQIGSPNMTVNGVSQEIDPGRGTQPVIINGTTLVPIRTIIENMGGTIAWNPDLRQITMTANNKTIVMTLNYTVAKVRDRDAADWVQKTVLVAPKLINGRTMVPLRFVTEELGAAVGWEQASKRITITLAVAAADPYNWTGSWETDSGIMAFNQSGSNVATVANNQYFGKITGTVSGKTLTGKWFVAVDCQGDIILTMSDDGKSFTGKYNNNYPGNPFVPDPEDPEWGWYSIAGQR